MLADLEGLIDTCRRNYDNHPYKGDIKIDKQFSDLLKSHMSEKETVTVYEFSVLTINADDLRVEFPSTWFWYALYFNPLWKALEEYKTFLSRVTEKAIELGAPSQNKKSFLKTLPNENWESNLSNTGWISPFKMAIKDISASKNDEEYFINLISTRDWWIKTARTTTATSGKTLERNDVFQSSLDLAMKVVVANAAKLSTIVQLFSEHADISSDFERLVKNRSLELSSSTYGTKPTGSKVAEAGENRIFYGAPGTGKSHQIRSETKGATVVCTVFHSETQNSDFIGCLRPSTEINGDISYAFRAGPFITALCKAVSDPTHQYYLIIEEINRASAAAVFGEIFQLLDRDGITGRSEYEIDITDPEMYKYLKTEVHGKFDHGKLYIPGNLTLLATMNSSDQAVMPMDTAFKRRWCFNYMPLNFSEGCASGKLSIFDIDRSLLSIPWNIFATCINTILSNLSSPVSEDRHLGPWYLSTTELKNDPEGALSGKLFVYLWDDVLRHGLTDELFDSNIKTYGQLVLNQKNNKPVFNADFLSLLKNKLSESSDD